MLLAHLSQGAYGKQVCRKLDPVIRLLKADIVTEETFVSLARPGKFVLELQFKPKCRLLVVSVANSMNATNEPSWT